MDYYYKDTPNGRLYYSSGGTIRLSNGSWVSTPQNELSIKEGWIPFSPTPPEIYLGHDPIPENPKLQLFLLEHPYFKDVIKTVSSGTVYHYTRWEVLFNKILSKENIANHYAILRGYSVNYMNDSTEGLLIPQGLSDAEDAILLKKAAHLFEHSLYQKRKEMILQRAKQDKILSFSVSFSKEPDLLPMWNLYGHHGEGVSIGFDVCQINNQGYDLLECIYDNRVIHEICEALYKTPDSPVVDLTLIGKNHHFEYEKECKIPLRHIVGDYCVTRREQFHPIQFDIKNGFIVPFVEVFLPLTAITEIWIGPTKQSNLSYDSLRMWLDRIGMEWVRIEQSTAPLQ